MTPPEDAIPEDAELPLGKVIAGNFRIERLIGSGAMGNVYQAEQLSLGKEVAVKVLHPHLATDAKLVRRFQREAKSASRLNHANSIQIIDSGQDASGALYIAMELLSGRDLAQVIRDEFPLPVPRIVRIVSQVLAALDEAHAHGVIHRDLKPSNIMLIERRGQPDFVKVCDYGIAKAQLEEEQGDAQMLTVQGLVCGTPEYMSPEQARGEPLDGRADLYAVAVILYHMVTGDIPFRAATPIGIVSRHLSETPVVPSLRRPDPSIPSDLDDLILRGLAKSRELRPATALLFREELENIGSGRVGRRERSAENTIPANQPISGVEITAQVPAVVPTVVSAPGATWLRGPRSWVTWTLILAVLVVVAATFVRRSRLAPSAGTAAAAASAAVPLPVSALVAAPVPPPRPVDPPAEALPSPPEAPGRERTDVGRKRVASGRVVTAPAQRGIAAAVPAAAPRGTAGTARVAAPAHPGAAQATGGGTENAQAAPPPAGDDRQQPGRAGVPREIIAEAERLLSQGEVGDACRHGEEAKNAAPRLAAIYKFLGKCYMRAGDPTHAKENYRRYLELNPGAADALFIESIVK